MALIPHGHCYLWQTSLVSLHVIADGLIALAYYSIPLILVYFVRRRQDIPYPEVFWLFSAFIVACGTTHLMSVWTLWHPDYWVSGLIKGITAIVSLGTAATLISIVPQALALRSPAALEAANQRLAQEVAERKSLQQEVEAREALLTAFFEAASSADIGLCIIDDRWRYRQINQALADINGVLAEQHLGQTIAEVLPDLAPVVTEVLEEVKQVGQAVNREVIGETPKLPGVKRYWLASYFPILNPEQIATAFGIVVVEVSKLKRMEQTLQTVNQNLARSNQELQDFAYVASHDLQEPLRKIQAFGDRLQTKYSQALGEKGQDYLRRMNNASQRMQTLIQDLLMFSRVTTKAQPFTAVNLNTVVQNVCSDLEMRIEQTQGQIEIDELGTIEADPLQMRQMFQNLIGNALKFHRPDVPPKVKVDQSVQDPANPFIRLQIADNGIGFEPKYLDRIFIPFQRLHGRSEYEGTGIGLAICRKIVERHGGQITANSRPGEGTVFTVTLPKQQTP